MALSIWVIAMIPTLAWANPDLQFCLDGDDLKAPVVEYRSADGKNSVLLVGMVHAGTPHYYRRASQYVAKFVGNGPKPVAIVNEFMTCKGAALQANPEALTENQIKAIERSGDLLKLDLPNLAKLIGAESLKQRTSCVRDAQGVARPQFWHDMARRGCDTQKRQGHTCQPEAFKLPTGKDVRMVDGDLVIDELPAGTQWWESLRHLNTNKVSAFSQPFVERLRQEHSLARRDERAVAQTLQSLKQSPRAILPWGVSHLTGIARRLEQHGFRKVKAERISFAQGQELGPSVLRNFHNHQKNGARPCDTTIKTVDPTIAVSDPPRATK